MSTRTITKRHLFAAWAGMSGGAALYRLWNPFGMSTWGHVAEFACFGLTWMLAVWINADKED